METALLDTKNTMSNNDEANFDAEEGDRPQPSAPPLEENHDINSDSDARAHAAAAQAREQGTALIRDHLQGHLEHNPGGDYVSWIATLHPENASIKIDPRFHIPGNPWLTVFEEARRDLPNPNTPLASAPPLVAEVEIVSPSQPNSKSRADNGEEGLVIKPPNESPVPDVKEIATPRPLPHDKSYGGILDLSVGLFLVVAALGTTVIIEVIALYIYLSAALCWRIVRSCSTPHVTVLSFLPWAISYVLYWVFTFVDTILLFVSVSVVELIAAINAAVCAVLALSCHVGTMSHQRTRRMAHLTRWAFRRPFEDWEPLRACGKKKEVIDEEEQGLEANQGEMIVATYTADQMKVDPR